MGGGRYDGLAELMGGPALPAVGWAAGIERLAMLIDEPPEERRPVAIIPAGEEMGLPALKLADELRRSGFVVELGYSGNMKKRLQRADKTRARVAVILGETEMARGAVVLRDLDKGEQEEVPLAELAYRLGTFY
jgi:histidyl-tRNA synthetase